MPKASYKQFTPRGAVKAELAALAGGGLPPKLIGERLGKLRKRGIPDPVIASYLGFESLARLGMEYSAEIGRLGAVRTAPEETDARALTLDEQARRAATQILKKSVEPQYHPDFMKVGLPGVPPLTHKVLNGRLRQATRESDWRAVSELVGKVPAIRQAAVSTVSFAGNIATFQPLQPTDPFIRTAAAIMSTGGAWQWEKKPSVDSASWHSVTVGDDVVPVVRLSTLFGRVHRRRVELRDHNYSRPEVTHYTHDLTLGAEEWLAADKSLAEMLEVDVQELPNDMEGQPMKPDDITELSAFIEVRDDMLAPIQSILIARQEWQPTIMPIA